MKRAVHNGRNVNLVETIEDIQEIRDKLLETKTTGVDTETTGLSFVSDHMVGLCVAVGKKVEGYYLPVRHNIGKNLPLDIVLDLAQEMILHKSTLFFNRNFDFNMLEKEGVNIPYKIDTHDVQPMCWMATNEGFPSLKVYSRNYLKFKMIDYGEAANDGKEGENHNFGQTDPALSFVYAAFDPVATVLLGQKMWDSYPYIRKIYPIDNKVTECCRLLGKEHINLDFNILRKSLEEEERELRSLRQRAIAIAGYEFNIGSNKDKGEALSRFVTLTVKTKTGQFSVKDEVLQEVDHPLAQILLDYSKKIKFIGSYLKPLLAMEGKPIYINYKTVDVPTGRLASGQVKGNDYYAKFNIQSTPKKEFKRFIHEDPDLGYILNDEKEGSLGSQKVKGGIRDAFICADDEYFVTADFKGEEITIAANLSGEDVWLDAINKGEDVHTNTAKAVFNVADDEARGKIKIFNFMTLYGANEFTIAKRVKTTVAAAKEMLDLYYRRLPKLSRWKDYVIAQARRKGMVFTYYGRPRLLYKYYSSSDPKLKAFADRSAVNSIVQGCIPLECSVELKDRASVLNNNLGKKVKLSDNREAIISSRGTGRAWILSSKRGEFLVADEEHKLVHGSLNNPKERRVCDGLDVPLLTSKLRTKLFPSLKTLWKYRKGGFEQQIIVTTLRSDIMRSRENSALFLMAFLTRKKITFDNIYRAAHLRSGASVNGYNLVMTSEKDVYRVKLTRQSKVYIGKAVRQEICMIGSMTMTSGFQYYPSQGFMNKNTGGDIMRILLCRLFSERDEDPEFKANARIMFNVHDEVNCYVKRHYLHTFYYILREFMTIQHDNWRAPLTADIGVSKKGWGHCLDAIGVTKDNKLVVRGINDKDLELC